MNQNVINALWMTASLAAVLALAGCTGGEDEGGGDTKKGTISYTITSNAAEGSEAPTQFSFDDIAIDSKGVTLAYIKLIATPTADDGTVGYHQPYEATFSCTRTFMGIQVYGIDCAEVNRISCSYGGFSDGKDQFSCSTNAGGWQALNIDLETDAGVPFRTTIRVEPETDLDEIEFNYGETLPYSNPL